MDAELMEGLQSLSSESKSVFKTAISQYLEGSVSPELLDSISNLSDDEYEVFMKMLEEASSGVTDTYEEYSLVDYEEIPVSIEEFITNPEYIGRSTNNGQAIYPYWFNLSKEVFSPGSKVQEVALTGCFTGDTKIRLLSGVSKTIKDIYDNIDVINDYAYAYDLNTNEYTVGVIEDVFCNGVKDVYKITLDNGESFKCTSNHRFLTRDKHWKSIDSGLSINDSLMPFNSNYEQGYEVFRNPSINGMSSKKVKTHQMATEWRVGKLYGDKRVVHHKNGVKTDNRPENLMYLKDTSTHAYYHAIKGNNRHITDWIESIPEKERLELLRSRMANATKIRWSMDSQREKASRKFSEMNRNKSIRKKQTLGRRKSGYLKKFSEETTLRNKERLLSNNISKDTLVEVLSTSKSRRESAEKLSISMTGLSSLCYQYSIDINEYLDVNPKYPKTSRYWNPVLRFYYDVYNEIGDISDESRDKYYDNHPEKRRMRPRVSDILKKFDLSIDEFKDLVLGYNHRIVSIEYVGKEMTYDLQIKDHHNYVLDCGIVAHNSIGTGKSTEALILLSYSLYKLLCLKNPAKYYQLLEGSKIAIALFNISLNQVYGIGYGKFQSLLKKSPWFLRHGSLVGRNAGRVTSMITAGEQVPDSLISDLTYYPGKDIHIVVGSQESNFTGYDVFCMSGDTEILTGSGYKRLEDIVDKVRVYSQDNLGNLVLSDLVDVIKTKYVTELVEIVLEDGSTIRCTSDHLLRLSDGSYKKAVDITEDDDLMEVSL